VILHICDDFPEFLSENIAKQRSSHIQSFLSVVISVIFSGSVKESSDKSVDHISSEESLFELISFLKTDMRQQLLSEYSSGDIDSSLSVTLDFTITPHCDNVVINDAVDGRSFLSNKVKTIVLSLINSGFFKRRSEGFSHVCILIVVENHVKDLLVTLTAQRSEEDNDGNIFSYLGNGSVNLPSSLSSLDVHLELKSGFVGFFVL
jgi:hypothetical protein